MNKFSPGCCCGAPSGCPCYILCKDLVIPDSFPGTWADYTTCAGKGIFTMNKVDNIHLNGVDYGPGWIGDIEKTSIDPQNIDQWLTTGWDCQTFMDVYGGTLVSNLYRVGLMSSCAGPLQHPLFRTFTTLNDDYPSMISNNLSPPYCEYCKNVLNTPINFQVENTITLFPPLMDEGKVLLCICGYDTPINRTLTAHYTIPGTTEVISFPIKWKSKNLLSFDSGWEGIYPDVGLEIFGGFHLTVYPIRDLRYPYVLLPDNSCIESAWYFILETIHAFGVSPRQSTFVGYFDRDSQSCSPFNLDFMISNKHVLQVTE